MRYIGIGILTMGCDNDQIIKEVDYDITLPLWCSGGFCIKFREQLSRQEILRLGLLEDEENEFEGGDVINELLWSITDLNGNMILCNQDEEEI